MCQASACLSNVFYASSHLFLSGPSEPGLPLILSISWAIKARPPSPRMEGLACRLAHERFMSGGKKCAFHEGLTRKAGEGGEESRSHMVP